MLTAEKLPVGGPVTCTIHWGDASPRQELPRVDSGDLIATLHWSSGNFILY